MTRLARGKEGGRFDWGGFLFLSWVGRKKKGWSTESFLLRVCLILLAMRGLKPEFFYFARLCGSEPSFDIDFILRTLVGRVQPD